SQAGPPRHDESLGVEHPDLLAGSLGRDTLLAERGDNEIGEADGGGAGAEEKDTLVLELAAGDLECVDQAGEHDASGALDVVLEAAHLVAPTSAHTPSITPPPTPQPATT